MSVPDPLLTVTGMRPMSKKTLRKASRVLIREDFDTTLPTTQEARDLVKEMRQEIEAKEVQLNKLREMLARQDETDITQAQAELNRLQGAFEIVSKECAEKLRPVQNAYNQQLAVLEGKKQFCQSLETTATERKKYLEALKEKTNTTMFNLEDPKVPDVSEKSLYPAIKTFAGLQSEVGSLKRNATLEKYTQSEMNKLNDALKRILKQATEEQKMAELNLNSAKEGMAVIRVAPKVEPVVDDDWIEAKRKFEFNQILLAEHTQSLARLNEQARKIEQSNRELVEESRKIREELIILNRYMPENDSTQANTRNELSREQIEIDTGKARIEQLNAKIKTEKGRLKPLTSKLEELPPRIESEKKKLESLQKKRQQVEEDLLKVMTRRSELLSEKQFGEDQYTTMLERIDQQTKRLAEIERRIAAAQETLKKQLVIMKLNDEMNNLKTMDFTRFTSIVSNVLAVQDEVKSVVGE